MCLGKRDSGDLESEGRDVCMPERQSDRDLCWGPDFTRERGVNVLVCVGVWGIERLLCVWGGDKGGGWLQMKSEVSIFEGL